jgi:hypothetical protein
MIDAISHRIRIGNFTPNHTPKISHNTNITYHSPKLTSESADCGRVMLGSLYLLTIIYLSTISLRLIQQTAQYSRESTTNKVFKYLAVMYILTLIRYGTSQSWLCIFVLFWFIEWEINENTKFNENTKLNLHFNTEFVMCSKNLINVELFYILKMNLENILFLNLSNKSHINTIIENLINLLSKIKN